MNLNAEERIDLRRAVREHVETLKNHVLQAVEAGEADRARAHVEEIRRYEALHARLRAANKAS